MMQRICTTIRGLPVATVIPPCETIGLIDLCAPAATIVGGAKVDVGQPWFLIQVPNLLWFVALALLIVLAIAIPMPSKAIDTTGYKAGD
jgi:hypothetical protein